MKIGFDKPSIPSTNAIKEELSAFADAIINDTETVVTIDDGANALEVAYRILNLI
jgi:hypothetical protein